MNALNLAQKAYSATSAPIRTDRGNEYEVFARITRQLKTACRETNYPDFIRALHENRQMWTLLAVDVADADNGLPRQLRAQIFYLAEFTQLHTSRIISGDGDVSALIEINTSVMRGLHQLDLAS